MKNTPGGKYLPRARVAQWIKRLTSNCAGGLSIVYLGENYVQPLYGVDSNLSITSIISILSTLIAPQLHRKPTQINWFGGSISSN